MRRAAPLLLLLAAAADAINTTTVLANDTILLGEHAVFVSNDTIVDGNKTIVIGNDTIIEIDGEHEPIIRKKRTFGELVFRGLADVLGYDVQRKPQADAAFPPPLAPVPGIDLPLQAAPAPPPPCAAPRAAPPPCAPPKPPPPPPCPPPPPPPCPKPRAAPPPCPPPRPKPPPPPPPCPKPRAAPKPKPRAPPPPPPPPPCAKPRASPCGAKDETGLEQITSNLQLSFNINRNRPSAPSAPAADQVEEFAPIAIEPRAAKLPAKQERKPQIFVDAFVVRDGVTQKVDTVDADLFNEQQAVLEDDYIDDEDDEAPQARQPAYDDYEDVQEPREKSQRQIGALVDSFWEQNKKLKKPKKLPKNHYKSVHFGDRDLANEFRRRNDEADSRQNLQQERSKSNRIPIPFSRDTDEEEYEGTTTTEDPHRPLRPRVLPPTEHNPNQIDTVTVRVPPIYKEKRPKKLHRGPDRDEEEQGVPYYYNNNSNEEDSDSDGENSAVSVQAEQTRKKRRKKVTRRTRSTNSKKQDSKQKEDQKEYDIFSELDYDYYGSKLPISEEEKEFRRLVVTDPPKDEELARIEEESFLDDHERLVEDPERIGEEETLDDNGRSDDSGRTNENEKIIEDPERSYDDTERTDENQRADSRERTDRLSPNAKIHETGYKNNYLKRTGVRVDDPRPLPQRKLQKKKA